MTQSSTGIKKKTVVPPSERVLRERDHRRANSAPSPESNTRRTMPQAAAATAAVPLLVQTMPLPGAKGAPHFTGKNVRRFVEAIELTGKAAGLSEHEMPPLLLRYSSRDVRETMAGEGSVMNGNDWSKAKGMLIFYYGSRDRDTRRTAEELRSFSKKSSRKKVGSLRALDRYFCNFSKKAGTLVADKLITQAENDHLFYRGLPSRIRAKIKGRLVTLLSSQGKALSAKCPPSVQETLAAARGVFDPEDIDFSPGRKSRSEDDESSSEDDSSSDESDDSDESDSDDGRKKGKGRGRSPGKRSKKSRDRRCSSEVRAKPAPSTTTTSQEGGQMKELKDLADSMRQLLAVHVGMSNRPPSTPPTLFSPQGAPRSCYMCGKTEGTDLFHRIGMGNCPDTRELIAAGVIQYSPQGGLVYVDGRQLPRSPGAGTGGIAGLIRQEIAQGRGGRDPPPHQSRAAMNLGLYADDQPVLRGGTVAMTVETAYAFPTTRAQAKAAGDDPVKYVRIEEEAGPSGARGPAVRKPADPQGEFTRTRETVDAPPAVPHPSNLEGSWRERAGVDQDGRDDEDNRQKGRGTKPFRFTSTVQEQVASSTVREQLLDTKVTISLREIIAVSPDLQRQFGMLVKTRREYNAKAGEWEVVETEADRSASNDTSTTGEPQGDEPGVAYLTLQPGEDPHEILGRYTSAVSLGVKKSFARVVPIVEGVFGGEKVKFLLDSGSELNLVTRRVWEQTGVPIDEDGKRWSLRGIGGESVSLLGCARDAPVQIGGKNFDHHFFVSTREHGDYDGILGQPWLDWFSADVSYNRGGPTNLVAYPSGDKKGAHTSVEICGAYNPRNADRLILTSHAHVEERAAGFQ
uniref:Gag n=1 Tax=Phanerochaete chrysosporium (strain RP-78 / ATCC MYA-4764 / FGSC 9002) TaxID=273507 RepID=Q45W60_PHACR|nr:Gag [Phanerochaete chrysosporium RP-78]